MSFRVDDEEMEMLAGHGASRISHAARVAYLLGIRPYMDFRTGLVGWGRRVSYQSLRELLEQAPVAGSHREERLYSTEAIRAVLRELVRVGLVRWIKSPERGLFFECLVAHRDTSSKNRNNTGTTSRSNTGNPLENTVEPSQDAGCEGLEPQEEPQRPYTEEQHTSGSPYKRERDAGAPAREPGMPECIPVAAWAEYEQERNLATGRVMSISRRLACWQELAALEAEGYDLEKILRRCVAHGYARFERWPDTQKQAPIRGHSHPPTRGGRYAGHEDVDNSAAGKVRRRAAERERQRQAADGGGVVIEGVFVREAL